MSTALRLTVKDFDHMVARGAFDWLGDRRLELIFGELREMNPPGPSHSEGVRVLNRWSHDQVSDSEARIRIQDPIAIPELDSSPQPDIVLAKAKNYEDEHPRPRDVLLLIEVSDTSLGSDSGEKAD